jgi:hypothetical protein
VGSQELDGRIRLELLYDDGKWFMIVSSLHVYSQCCGRNVVIWLLPVLILAVSKHFVIAAFSITVSILIHALDTELLNKLR